MDSSTTVTASNASCINGLRFFDMMKTSKNELKNLNNALNNNTVNVRSISKGNKCEKENRQYKTNAYCTDLYRPIPSTNNECKAYPVIVSNSNDETLNCFTAVNVMFESRSMPNISTNNNYSPRNTLYHRNSAYNSTENLINKDRANETEKRVHGLVLRFMRMSGFMNVHVEPSKLLNGGHFDQLSQAIWDVYENKSQKVNTFEKKVMFWKSLFILVKKYINSYSLYMVGSTMTGFGLDTSDIDMCILLRNFTDNPRAEAIDHLMNLRLLFMRTGVAANAEIVLARVPILKFRDLETGFEVDLNCNADVSVQNTQLLQAYARLDWRVRPLVVIVKLWAQANGINDAKNMTVSSYSWVLMVIHYLQNGTTPPVLPCLHKILPRCFNSSKVNLRDEDVCNLESRSENNACLAELLIGFFKYYTVFDYSRYAISIRTDLKSVEDCRNFRSSKNHPHHWKYLCIEEPVDFTNTAKSVYDYHVFNRIREIIKCSYIELVNTKLLKNVLPVVVQGEKE